MLQRCVLRRNWNIWLPLHFGCGKIGVERQRVLCACQGREARSQGKGQAARDEEGREGKREKGTLCEDGTARQQLVLMGWETASSDFGSIGAEVAPQPCSVFYGRGRPAAAAGCCPTLIESGDVPVRSPPPPDLQGRPPAPNVQNWSGNCEAGREMNGKIMAPHLRIHAPFRHHPL